MIEVSGLVAGVRVLSLEEGVRVEIDDGIVLEQPVRIAIQVPETGCTTRIEVQAGHGSRCIIAEEVTGNGVWTHEVRIVVEGEGKVEYASIQTLDASARATVKQYGEAQTGGAITWRNVTLGAGHVRCETESRLTGDDATSGIDWLFFGAGREKYELLCRNMFEGARGGGEVLMKGVAQDGAHVSCRGMIDIGLHGAGTNTYLTQDVLMLDPTAKVDAIPGLEIKTNDVKASHSAVVSRVTAEDLFYFGSRGIEQAVARRLFIEGFLGQLADRMPYAREAVLAAIQRKMGVRRLLHIS